MAPLALIAAIRSRHFRWNCRSPTARTSSMSNTSGDMCAATEKARRMRMPLL